MAYLSTAGVTVEAPKARKPKAINEDGSKRRGIRPILSCNKCGILLCAHATARKAGVLGTFCRKHAK